MAQHHTAGAFCGLCEEKLKSAHPVLIDWFHRLKVKYVNVHISWAWRGPEDQAKFLAEGKTKCPFPTSPHNHMIEGKPMSLALDLFTEDEDGVARYPAMFYARVNADNETNREPIVWGGKFKHLGDANHFEISAGKA